MSLFEIGIPTKGNQEFLGVTILEVPEEGVLRWCFPPLYKEKMEKILVWQIGFDLKEENLISRHGYNDGIIQEHKREVETKGKKSLTEQAFQEAKQRYIQQVREKLYHTFDEVNDNIGVMVGYKYESGKIPEGERVYVQAKIDGVRIYSILRDGQIFLGTRQNKPKQIPHIAEACVKLLTYLPSGTMIDGELYSEKLDFNGNISAINTMKITHDNQKLLRYWIFDIRIPENDKTYPYEIRQKMLHDAYFSYCDEISGSGWKQDNLPLRVVPSHECFNEEEIMEVYNHYLSLGYEGVVVKRLANNWPSDNKNYKLSLYKSGRTNGMLKIKPVFDKEGIVIDIIGGKGDQRDLAFVVVEDEFGNVFSTQPIGSFETRKEWLQNKEEYIGKKYTYRYQDLGDNGIPRFPKGVAFRDYE